MEVYVSNIPLLIYGGTLGELETLYCFKLNHGGPIYKIQTAVFDHISRIVDCSVCRLHCFLFHPIYYYMIFEEIRFLFKKKKKKKSYIYKKNLKKKKKKKISLHKHTDGGY